MAKLFFSSPQKATVAFVNNRRACLRRIERNKGDTDHAQRHREMV